jgi:hypothetical protein
MERKTQKHTIFKGSNFPNGIKFMILSRQTSDGMYHTIQIQDDKGLQTKDSGSITRALGERSN